MTEHHDDYKEAFEPEGSAPATDDYQEQARPPRRERERERDRGRPRHDGPRRFSGDRGRRDFRSREEEEVDPRVAELIRETEGKLEASYRPVQVENLNAFERKQFHRHFERRKSSYQTKTYRNEDNHVLWIFPVGNLKRFLEGKAKEALANGASLALPAMSSYERFLAHNILKELGTVESTSEGEGEERRILIQPKELGAVESTSEGEGEERHLLIQPKKVEPPSLFGRSLRKVAKKIKLM